MWVQSLGQEDPLEKGMAPHSRILAWRIPWTEKPGRLQYMGLKELDTTERVGLNHGDTAPFNTVLAIYLAASISISKWYGS